MGNCPKRFRAVAVGNVIVGFLTKVALGDVGGGQTTVSDSAVRWLAPAGVFVGEAVGNLYKDTAGPCLNILIKLMSMVSVVFAGGVVRYAHLGGEWLGLH